MKTREDIIRQASIFTSNGLIDPRVMPGYVSNKTQSNMSLGNKFRRVIENLFSKFEKRQASI
ncbi:MAG TPA: hypothetical protein VL443_00075 [Cyclobacteriaceae bacterium]|jgi:hypothetical protein|nr:hypothetical protein [Cyclobacteriaceae bacterium]